MADQQHEEEEQQLFTAACFAINNNGESWLIDSGCTHHKTYKTYDEELFKDLNRTINSKVKIGNGECITVKRKGIVAIESCSGTKIIINVLYVPEINQNLLSVGQLLEKGYKVLFEDKMCLIQDAKEQDLLKVKMKGKSFSLDLMEEVQASISSTINVTELWHKRLGHFNHASLLHMKKQNVVKGLPSLEDHVSSCGTCQYGK